MLVDPQRVTTTSARHGSRVHFDLRSRLDHDGPHGSPPILEHRKPLPLPRDLLRRPLTRAPLGSRR